MKHEKCFLALRNRPIAVGSGVQPQPVIQYIYKGKLGGGKGKYQQHQFGQGVCLALANAPQQQQAAAATATAKGGEW